MKRQVILFLQRILSHHIGAWKEHGQRHQGKEGYPKQVVDGQCWQALGQISSPPQTPRDVSPKWWSSWCFTEAAEPKDEEALKRWEFLVRGKLLFPKFVFFFKWTNCYFVGGTEKKMRKKDFFGTGCLRHFCHDMLMNFANCIHSTYQKLPLELGSEWRKLQPLGFKKRRLPSQCNWKIEKVLQGLPVLPTKTSKL